ARGFAKYLRASTRPGAAAATDAPPQAPATAPVAKTRRRLFTKYVALFVAVVCIALVSNGVFDVLFYYQEHKASLIRIQREQAEAGGARRRKDRPVHQGDREPTRLDHAAAVVGGLDRAAPLRRVAAAAPSTRHHRARPARRHRQRAAARVAAGDGRGRQRRRP